MSETSKSAQDLERQLRQACEGLEHRLRAGENYRTEDCLAALPELAGDSDATLELLYFEYVLREELGQSPARDDWYRRFPEQQTALAKIFDIHHEVRDDSTVGLFPNAKATFALPGTLKQDAPRARTRLSKYVLLEELGRGSMGVVYKAREPALDRKVALKMLLAGSHAGLDQLVRVHREARAIARLRHPNIVQIYDIGEDEGRPFLCMEYVEGPSLDRLLARCHEQGSLGVTPADAARLMQALADAVHYAHQQGIIHRDLKPANILLSGAGGAGRGQSTDLSPLSPHLSSLVPKIADFGLAKFLDGSSEATQTGHMMGTPSFMAPEQADGRNDEVGPRTDVHALGMILYQMLTGRPPFQAPTVQETLELVRTAEPPRPRELQPYLPRDLQTICLKCLAKEPANRYASAADLAEDLRRFLAGEPIRARPATFVGRTVKWIKRRPVVAALLAALLLTAVAGAAAVLWQWRRAELNADQAGRLARDFERERNLAIQERQRAERHLKRARDKVDELARLGTDLYGQAHMSETGRRLMEQVLEFYDEVLREESTDPEVRREAAVMCGRVANLRHGLGQWREALAARCRQSDLLEGLLADGEDTAYCRGKLAISLRSRGNILRDMRRTNEALAVYRRAAGLQKLLLAERPKDIALNVELANTLLNTATVLTLKDDAMELAALHNQAVELNGTAVSAEPNNLYYQSELALSLEGQALFYWHTGNKELAQAAIGKALQIRQQQREEGKLSRPLERYLAQTYIYQGIIFAATGRPREAEKLLRKSMAVTERLLSDFPHIPYHRLPHIEALTELSKLLKNQRRYAELEQINLEIIAHQEKLVVDFPEEVSYRSELLISLVKLASIYVELGRYRDAAAQFPKVLRLYARGAGPERMKYEK